MCWGGGGGGEAEKCVCEIQDDDSTPVTTERRAIVLTHLVVLGDGLFVPANAPPQSTVFARGVRFQDPAGLHSQLQQVSQGSQGLGLALRTLADGPAVKLQPNSSALLNAL